MMQVNTDSVAILTKQILKSEVEVLKSRLDTLPGGPGPAAASGSVRKVQTDCSKGAVVQIGDRFRVKLAGSVAAARQVAQLGAKPKTQPRPRVAIMKKKEEEQDCDPEAVTTRTRGMRGLPTCARGWWHGQGRRRQGEEVQVSLESFT